MFALAAILFSPAYKRFAVVCGFTFFWTANAFALGSYSEGQAVVRLTKFESKGIIYESYEGIVEVASFDPGETCDEAQDKCYKPTVEAWNVSVRPENSKVVNFMQKNVHKEMVIFFRKHRITPVALSTDTEIIDVKAQTDDPPEDLPSKKVVQKSGTKRNFTLRGKILRLEYKGTVVGTYEGLYVDLDRRTVHNFSIVDADMAAFAQKVLLYGKDYSIGVSVSFTKATRESYYDIFEINLTEQAGSLPETGG